MLARGFGVTIEALLPLTMAAERQARAVLSA